MVQYLGHMMQTMGRMVLCCSLVVVSVPDVSSIVAAQVQDESPNQLDKAEEWYNSGQYDSAETTLTRYLQQKKLTRDQKMAAYRLLALTYIARDHDIQAKEAVKSLLESAPNYNPDDADDPESLRNLVAESREEVFQQDVSIQSDTRQSPTSTVQEQEEEQPRKPRKWYYIAGGIFVALLIIASIPVSPCG